jgi:hypothetical protein
MKNLSNDQTGFSQTAAFEISLRLTGKTLSPGADAPVNGCAQAARIDKKSSPPYHVL